MRVFFRIVLIFGIGAIGTSIPVSAHHSTAEFDANPMPVEVQGVITRIDWRNPHVELRLRRVDERGNNQELILGAPSAIAMRNTGIDRALFDVGMRVSVYGPVSARRNDRMLAWNILLPDEREVVMNSALSEPRWSDEAIGAGGADAVYSATGPVPDDGHGIFRIWSWEPVAEFWMMREPQHFPLTAAAIEAQSHWDEDDPSDNGILRCEPPGMPATMGDPHPIEFVDLGDSIQIRMEEFDQTRTIHMSDTPDLEQVPRSPLGYSVGRWEEGTLIVDTSRLNARYFNRHGIPLSEQASIEERFTLDAPNGKLAYVLKVTDPVNLTVPFVEALAWNWNERASLQRYDCASGLFGDETISGSGTDWFGLRNALVAFGIFLFIGFLVRRYWSRGQAT